MNKRVRILNFSLFLVGKDTPSKNSKAGQQRCGRSKLSTTGAHERETTKVVPLGEKQKNDVWKYVALVVFFLELQSWSLTTEDLDRIHDSMFGHFFGGSGLPSRAVDAIDLVCFDTTRMILQALAAALSTQHLDEKEALALLDDFYGGAKHMRPHI